MLSAVEGPPRGVQIKKEDAEGPAWDRSREEAGGSSVTDGSMENFNPAHFTAQLPPAMRLPGPSMSINYRKTIKLFFKAEKTLRDLCAPQGFLELSGRMIWAHEGSQHAFALSSPFKTDNNVQDRSLEKDLWPGQIREVFFRKNKTTEPFWSYAGTYKCHKLPPMTAAEYIALDEATRNSLLFSAFPDSPIHQELAATIDDLYRQGILKIQRIGLQYLGFNQNLYVAMKLISEQRHSAGAGPSSSGSKRQVGDGDGDEKPRKKAKNKRRAGGGSGAYT
ncbi:hypothetical protein B0H21DRAFT_76695 [Amylocystis lapponica]|nr:hypothetical protein B0H21DRAFT_76695 [Amylocystis lapponica]